MKKLKQILRGNKGTFILLAAAVVLLASSALGSARAALTYFSENYTAQMEVQDIGVTLAETSVKETKDISSRDYAGSDDEWKQKQGALLQNMLEETDGELVLGRDYKEQLFVRNSGNIDEYVRVSVVRSWTDDTGEKLTTLAPGLIVLNMTQSGWIIDTASSTEEKTVLYWPNILKAGEATEPFTDSIRIDEAIASKVTQTTTEENGFTTVTTSFNYDNARFNLNAEVDAVQTHNASDAIKSAWGVDVKIASDGTLRIVQ